MASSYVVLDTETTGLGSDARIIEIAAVRVENGEITGTFSELIDPKMHLSQHITSFTGIHNDMLRGARTADEVLPDFLSFIGELPLVGHKIDFDLRMLNNEMARLDIELPCVPVYDTYEYARQRYPHWPHYRLSDLCRNFGIQSEGAHRALADAKATQLCFERLLHAPIGSVSFVPEKNVEYVRIGKPNLQGLSFCITGDPIAMIKDAAHALIMERDGIVKTGVSGKLTYLVNCFTNGYESGKLKKARTLISEGKPISIITEDDFLAMCGVFREDDKVRIRAAKENPLPQADGDSFPCTPADIDTLYLEHIFNPVFDGYQEGGFGCKMTSNKRLIYSFYETKAFEFKPGPRGKSRLYLPASIMQVLFPDNDYPDSKYYPVVNLTDAQMEKLIQQLRVRRDDAFRARGEPFACCNSYVECSDQGGCLHKSECFYNACEYRRNLEAGRIFYGKNRNV